MAAIGFEEGQIKKPAEIAGWSCERGETRTPSRWLHLHNGLKEQYLESVSPIQKPIIFRPIHWMVLNKVSWMLLLRSVNTSASKGLAYQQMIW
jgi:hypothetical protein